MSEYTSISYDKTEIERSLRERALQMAGHHMAHEPFTASEALKRANAYLEFLKAGDSDA